MKLPAKLPVKTRNYALVSFKDNRTGVPTEKRGRIAAYSQNGLVVRTGHGSYFLLAEDVIDIQPAKPRDRLTVRNPPPARSILSRLKAFSQNDR